VCAESECPQFHNSQFANRKRCADRI